MTPSEIMEAGILFQRQYFECEMPPDYSSDEEEEEEVDYSDEEEEEEEDDACIWTADGQCVYKSDDLPAFRKLFAMFTDIW